MFGMPPKCLQSEEKVPDQVRIAFRAFLEKHRRELASSKDNQPEDAANIPFVVLAKALFDDFHYCLVRTPRTEGKSLSAQQIKIATLIADGLSNKEIAGKLGIKRGTVSSHIIQIYNKLNIDNRVALTRHVLLAEAPPRFDPRDPSAE